MARRSRRWRSTARRARCCRSREKPPSWQSLAALSDGPLFLEGGGQLVRDKTGEVVGALGVTGDVNEVDDLCAMDGIRSAGFLRMTISTPLPSSGSTSRRTRRSAIRADAGESVGNPPLRRRRQQAVVQELRPVTVTSR